MINLDDLKDGFWLVDQSFRDAEEDTYWVNFSNDLMTRHGKQWRAHVKEELDRYGARLMEFNVNVLDEDEEWLYEDSVQLFAKFESPEAYSMFRLRWS